jgi:ABC-type branched-subunit amino acid transport system substrate-binding protein
VAKEASDQGVTPDTVTLGVALVNLDYLSRTGVAASNGTVDERTRVWQALVADANSRGGAAGRQIKLAVRDFDPLSASSGADMCRGLSEDEQVFTVITDVGIEQQIALCFTRQYGIPMIVYDSQDITTLDQSGGLMFTTMPSNDRIVYNHVAALHQRGLLQGKKIGLVSTDQGGSKAPERTAIPALESFGYQVAHRSHLSDDIPTAQSQIPVEINQMRSAGVDFVIWDGGPTYSNLWLNQAQKTGYNTTYSFDELASGTDDFAIQTVGQQIDGYAWGVRRRADRKTDAPTAPSDQACTDKASQASGVAMARTSDLYRDTVEYCSQLSAFIDAINASGTNPTRPDFAATLANLGQRPDLEPGPAGVGGSWSPGKPDAADYQREMHHDPACRCWKPAGDWFALLPIGG